MDEKKLDQVQNLEDEQLENVSGGSRILAANSAEAANDESDDKGFIPRPFFPYAYAANDSDEELDGGIPHLPPVKPTRPR